MLILYYLEKTITYNPDIFNLDERCNGCGMPIRLCICQSTPKINNKTFCSFLIHRNEIFKPSNTSLPCSNILQNSDLTLRGISPEKVAKLTLREGYTPLYLFPDSTSVSLESIDPNKGPYQLIIPDGTWRHARHTKRRFQNLSDVPSVKLPENLVEKSVYSLRCNRITGRVCTMEAVAFALGYLESVAIKEQLIDFVKILVERVKKRPDPKNP